MKTFHFNSFNTTAALKRLVCVVALLALVAAAVFAEGTYYPGKKRSVPDRVVSLGPAATETLFAVGAGNQLVARTDFCNYPAEAAAVPSVGGFDGKALSLESIVACEPDLVVLYADMHDHLVDSLRAFGIGVYVSNAATINDVYKEITTLAAITGHDKNGEKLVKKMKKQLKAIKRPKGAAPTVYYEVWNAPYMTVGKGSFINELLAAAGLVPVFGTESTAYPVVSEESILARNPDIILLPNDGMTTPEDVLARENWKAVSACKNGRVYFVDADLMNRAGPRIVDAIKSIADLVRK